MYDGSGMWMLCSSNSSSCSSCVATAAPAGQQGVVRPGDVVTTTVTYAAPHHLVADGEPVEVRRTRSGDAWEARTTAAPARAGVSLGMPGVGVPAERPAAGSPMQDCGSLGPA